MEAAVGGDGRNDQQVGQQYQYVDCQFQRYYNYIFGSLVGVEFFVIVVVEEVDGFVVVVLVYGYYLGV